MMNSAVSHDRARDLAMRQHTQQDAQTHETEQEEIADRELGWGAPDNPH